MLGPNSYLIIKMIIVVRSGASRFVLCDPNRFANCQYHDFSSYSVNFVDSISSQNIFPSNISNFCRKIRKKFVRGKYYSVFPLHWTYHCHYLDLSLRMYSVSNKLRFRSPVKFISVYHSNSTRILPFIWSLSDGINEFCLK